MIQEVLWSAEKLTLVYRTHHAHHTIQTLQKRGCTENRDSACHLLVVDYMYYARCCMFSIMDMWSSSISQSLFRSGDNIPKQVRKKKWGRKAGARNGILSITTAQAVLGKDSFSGLELYNATGHNCVECPTGTKESGTSQSDPTLEAWVSHGEKPLP